MNLEVSVVIRWNLSFGTPLFIGHLHSGYTKFGPGKKKVHITFVSVTSIEGIPLFRGKGHFFGSQRIPQHSKRDWPQRGLISLSVH